MPHSCPAHATPVPQTRNGLRGRCAAVLLAALVASAAPAQEAAVGQPAGKGRKVALLVGVGSYKHTLADLNGVPERDATALEKQLKPHGFEVHTLTGAKGTKRAIEAKFKSLLEGGGDAAKALGKGDILLVQMCMHGFTVEVNGKKEPYLAGHDARPDDPGSLVGLNDLIRESAPFGATTLFLIDACRETTDPNRGGTRGVEGAQLALPRNTAVMFSCGVGQVAHQPDRLRHGLFTYAVLKALKGETGLNGPVSWADLVSHVGKAFRSPEIKKHIPAGQPQTPFAVQGESEDVELARVKPAAAAAKIAPADLAADAAAVRAAALLGDDLADALRAAGGGRVAEWKAAAAGGDPAAQYLYALALADGIGVPADEKAAIALLEKASAAGDAWAMGALGGLFAGGRVEAPRARVAAVEWCRKGAAAGNPVAMHHLADLHDAGDGVEQDDAKAAAWYRKAADAGHAVAMTRTGVSYEHGRGVPADPRQAAAWYEKAAAKGEPKAMNNLGFLHQTGRGVEQDHKKAVGWYRTAAKLGNAAAMGNLGFMYQQGYGTTQSHDEALKWFNRAAEREDPGAYNNLGFMYQKGYGVKADPKKAFEWYEKAADARHPTGTFNAGYCHANGIGTPRNVVKAREYYKKAAEMGNERAKAELQKLGG